MVTATNKMLGNIRLLASVQLCSTVPAASKGRPCQRGELQAKGRYTLGGGNEDQDWAIRYTGPFPESPGWQSEKNCYSIIKTILR